MTDTMPAAFSQSLNAPMMRPLRPALTGDDNMNRKFAELDYPLRESDSSVDFFSQSMSGAAAFGGSNVARARPRTNTPHSQTTAAGLFRRKVSKRIKRIFFVNQYICLFRILTAMHFQTPVLSRSQARWARWQICRRGRAIAATSQTILHRRSHSTSPQSKQHGSAFRSQWASTSMYMLGSRAAHPIGKHYAVYTRLRKLNGKNILRPVVKVFATLMASFPAAYISQLIDYSSSCEPLAFSITNASRIKLVQPCERLVLNISESSPPTETLSFTVQKQQLANYFFEQQQAKPDATFYNVDVSLQSAVTIVFYSALTRHDFSFYATNLTTASRRRFFCTATGKRSKIKPTCEQMRTRACSLMKLQL